MSIAHQRWENRPGPTVGYQATAHRQHYTGDGPNCRKQVHQQNCHCNMPSFNIVMHSASDVSQKCRDPLAFISQAAAVSNEKSAMSWQRASSHELFFPSQPSEEPETSQSIGFGFAKQERTGSVTVLKSKAEKKSTLHVHFQIASAGLHNIDTSSPNKIANGSNPPPSLSSSSSSSSSSIGQVSDGSSCLTHKASEESEVQSTLRSPFDQMNVLEDSLPIKKGLSRFYNGKSRSFTCLADVSSLTDLTKPEDPYAKKRKWVHRHQNNNKSRLGYPPICHARSSCSKVALSSGSCPSSQNGSDDTLEDPVAFTDTKDQRDDRAPPRSYSLSDLEASERRIAAFSKSFHFSSPDQ